MQLTYSHTVREQALKAEAQARADADRKLAALSADRDAALAAALQRGQELEERLRDLQQQLATANAAAAAGLVSPGLGTMPLGAAVSGGIFSPWDSLSFGSTFGGGAIGPLGQLGLGPDDGPGGGFGGQFLGGFEYGPGGGTGGRGPGASSSLLPGLDSLLHGAISGGPGTTPGPRL